MCTQTKSKNNQKNASDRVRLESYDPAKDPFWAVLGGLMMIGAVLHMRRVHGGWMEWTECKDIHAGDDFMELLGKCWNYNTRGKKMEGSLWKVFHFSGGVVWMFGGLVQLLLWKRSRTNPKLRKWHKWNGIFMLFNAIILVALVGGLPAYVDAYKSFSPVCSIPALFGGLPGVILTAANAEHLGCHEDFAFMPHFLIWAVSAVCALFVAMFKSARDKTRRVEHMAWGLFIAGIGCFDSVNYLVKHVFLYLDWFDNYTLYHFIVAPTPFFFIAVLITKCRLSKMYRLQDIWFSFTVNHIRAYVCDTWVPVKAELRESASSTKSDEPTKKKDVSVAALRSGQSVTVLGALYFVSRYFNNEKGSASITVDK